MVAYLEYTVLLNKKTLLRLLLIIIFKLHQYDSTYEINQYTQTFPQFHHFHINLFFSINNIRIHFKASKPRRKSYRRICTFPISLHYVGIGGIKQKRYNKHTHFSKDNDKQRSIVFYTYITY